MTDDELAAAYLYLLRRAARPLPRTRRKELIEAIEAHIAEARAAGTVPLEDVLDDLGEPGEIVAAAGGDAREGAGGQQIAAIILLLVGGVIFFIGWAVGVVLLWTSARWRWYDKLLATLVWPGGLFGVLLFGASFAVTSSGGSTLCSGGAGQATTCVTQGGGGLPAWLEILIVVLIIAAPVAVAMRLLRRARLASAQAEPLIPNEP